MRCDDELFLTAITRIFHYAGHMLGFDSRKFSIRTRARGPCLIALLITDYLVIGFIIHTESNDEGVVQKASDEFSHNCISPDSAQSFVSIAIGNTFIENIDNLTDNVIIHYASIIFTTCSNDEEIFAATPTCTNKGIVNQWH